MDLKLVVAITEPDKTELLVNTARQAGATGATILNNARGEGLLPHTGFLGLQLDSQSDLVLFVVRADRADAILEEIGRICEMNEAPGTGVAFTLDVEKAVGLRSQIADSPS